MKAVCYARVSTPGQAEGYSLETQHAATEQLARRLGATAIEHIEDTYTGTALNRPAMNYLRDLVRRRACDIVVVYDPDRFSRNLTDLLIIAREFDRAGVALHFVNFSWEDSPTGRLFLQMRGAIAEFEHALILERTTRGKTRKAALGKLRTYAQPYGYRFDRDTDSLVIYPPEAAWVQRIFEWWVQEQLSTWAIAQRLAALGVPGPKGPTWSYVQVWRILRSRTYVGQLVRRDERPDWEPVRVPPIVDEALWQQAQTLWERRKRFNPRSTRGTFLLQGLLRCGACGRRLTVFTTTQRGRRWSYYTCRGRHRRVFGPEETMTRCPTKPIRTDDLDQQVWDQIRQFLAHSEQYVDELRQLEAVRQGPIHQRLAEARARLRHAREAEDRVHRAYVVLNALDEATYARYLAECRETAAAAQRDIDTLAGMLRATADWEALRRAVQSAAARPGSLEDRPFPERQAMVRDLIDEVVVFNDRIEIHGALEPPVMPSATNMEKRAVQKLLREIDPEAVTTFKKQADSGGASGRGG